MIVAKIIGGLGNQIAQYAFARACADRLGVTLKLDIAGFSSYALHAYGLDRFRLRAEVASVEEVVRAQQTGVVQERTTDYDPAIISQVRDGIYLNGYWGDYRYVEDILPRLAQEFVPVHALHPANQSVLTEIQNSESVSLHVRRGDYVTNPNCWVMPLTYYEDAVDEISDRFPSVHFFVFSDDMDWVEAHLHMKGRVTYVKGNDASRNVDDFELMRACKHHIIANSTFSGWAAMLARQQGVTIAPQQYFRPDDPWLLRQYGRIVQPVWPPGWAAMPVRIAPVMDEARWPRINGGHHHGRPLRVAVWNYYELITTDGYLFKNQNVAIGHNLLQPWCVLHQYGQAHGLEFLTLDQVHDVSELDAVIFMDRPRPGNPRVDAVLGAKHVVKYLLLYETPVIKPDNWDVEFHAHFDRIFTWSDAHVDSGRYVKHNFSIDRSPQYDFEVLKTAFHQRKLCVMIAGAKQSPHPGELYSERIRMIRFFENGAPDQFDLYGVGWSADAFPSYRGAVKNKLSVLARYRFAICYENASGYPGYITEKILDCFLAGVVPVYWGAPNVERWIPKECFIDRREFASDEQVYRYLVAMPAEVHDRYLDRIRTFLSSSESDPFSVESFVSTLTTQVVSDVEARQVSGDARSGLEAGHIVDEVSDVSKPVLTVIVSTHERASLLGRALVSIRNQGCEEVQIIVVSDVSDTQSYLVAQSVLRGADLYLERRQRPGPAESRNFALDLVTAPYVMFLDDDDSFAPGFFRQLLDILATHEHPGHVMYCDPRFLEEIRGPEGVTFTGGYELTLGPLSRDDIAVNNRIPNNCLIFPRSAIGQRRFDPSLILFEDWEFLLNVLAEADLSYLPIKGPNIHKNDRALGERRGARNDDKLLDTIAEIYRKWPGRTEAVKRARQQHIAQTGSLWPLEML